MTQPIRLLLYILAILPTSCIRENESHTDYNETFLTIHGVTECDSTLGIYSYRDTMYYYDSTTKMLFKIPKDLKLTIKILTGEPDYG